MEVSFKEKKLLFLFISPGKANSGVITALPWARGFSQLMEFGNRARIPLSNLGTDENPTEQVERPVGCQGVGQSEIFSK